MTDAILLQHRAQTVPDADIEITALTTDSRSARRGSLSSAYPAQGATVTILRRVRTRAAAVASFAERPLDLAKDASVTVVSSTRRALAVIAQRFYGEPAASLRLIGITGTKGKEHDRRAYPIGS